MLSSQSDQAEPDRRRAQKVRIIAILTLLALLVSGCVVGSEAETHAPPTPSTANPQPPVSTAIPAPSPSSTPQPQPTEANAESTASPTVPASPTLEPAPAETAVTQPPIIDAVLQRAVEEFGVSPDVVELDSFSERFWSSTALGCPLPGRSYAQVIVPGFKVTVTVEGRPVIYHTANQHIVRCDDSAN